VVIYGPPGIGKTTFGAMAPNPVFILTEDGLGKQEVNHFPLAETFEDVIAALTALWEYDHEFQTVVLDSLDWLETLIWNRVVKDHGKSNIEDIGYAKGYIFALSYWGEVLQYLNGLRVHKNMMPVLLAHSQVKAFNDPRTEPYDRYSLKLHDKARAKVEEWAEIVGFAGYETFTRGDVKKGEKVKGVGKGSRLLYLEERPAFIAKNRFSLPPEITFDFGTFMDALSA
jgi:hypothetical protein